MVKLLSPAGDFEKLQYAIRYGADAVYLGGKLFSMRSNAGNFSDDEIKRAIDYAHERGVEVDIAFNIFARNADIRSMITSIKQMRSYEADSVIVSDPGIVYILKNELPDQFISLSTQANTTNSESILFWQKNGVNRVILARELGFGEIKEICQNKPDGIQIEVFVHGAMCISYSGRCLLSNYLTGRDSNRGDCAQPCRWRYTLKEETRPNEIFGVEEDAEGTYLFNSKDLCLIEHVRDLIDIGVDALKIEGRMKSIYYVSTVTNAYRRAIDRALNSDVYQWDDLYTELTKVSHRQYTKGFFEGYAGRDAQNYGTGSYTRNYEFIAEITENTDASFRTKIIQKNKFSVGDCLETVEPKQPSRSFCVTRILDAELRERVDAPHPEEVLCIETEPKIQLFQNTLLRRKRFNA